MARRKSNNGFLICALVALVAVAVGATQSEKILEKWNSVTNKIS